MEANSVTSIKTGKKSTGKTDRQTPRGCQLTPSEALEILAQSALNCQRVGLSISIVPLYDQGHTDVAIILHGAILLNGNIAMKGAP
jgi:uncharacterized protein GlcG (DUF336 family)